MMFYDFGYLLWILPGLVLATFASFYVRSAFRRFAEVPLARGLSGAEVAEMLLRSSGITNVRVEPNDGFLTDHYDPSEGVLRLSPEVYEGRSISAAGVAAHEAGHAVQHAEGYGLMTVRQALVLPARIGSQLAYVAILIGLAVHLTGLAWLGVVLFAGLLLFELVTIPVELDASRRAKLLLTNTGITTPADDEGVRVVLRAAALTYIAAFVTTALQLLYFVTRIRSQEH